MPSLATLLKRAYLGGAINEVAVKCGDRVASIQAIDMSNQVSVDVWLDIDLDKIGDFGIGNVGMLCRFLDANADNEVMMTRDENRLILTTKGHGELRYLLSEIDLIPTVPDSANELKEITDDLSFEMPLTKEVAKDLIDYLSWVKTSYVAIVFDPDTSEVFAQGGLESEHQFDVSLGRVPEKSHLEESFTVPFSAPHLLSILNVLEWSDDGPTLMLFDKDAPIAFTFDDNIWALQPTNIVE